MILKKDEEKNINKMKLNLHYYKAQLKKEMEQLLFFFVSTFTYILSIPSAWCLFYTIEDVKSFLDNCNFGHIPRDQLIE